MTREVLDAFSQVHDSGTTIVMITHDPLCALRADRILYIQDGTIADALEQKRWHAEYEQNRYDSLQQWLCKKGF